MHTPGLALMVPGQNEQKEGSELSVVLVSRDPGSIEETHKN